MTTVEFIKMFNYPIKTSREEAIPVVEPDYPWVLDPLMAGSFLHHGPFFAAIQDPQLLVFTCCRDQIASSIPVYALNHFSVVIWIAWK